MPLPMRRRRNRTRWKACNARAGDMKGDERKAYMRPACRLKSPKADGMCNKKTAGLKGDERSKAQRVHEAA